MADKISIKTSDFYQKNQGSDQLKGDEYFGAGQHIRAQIGYRWPQLKNNPTFTLSELPKGSKKVLKN